MNELDFHIDETVIHSATIDQKKDFEKLMADFNASQRKTSSLGSYWMMTSVVVCIALLSLSAFYGQDMSQEPSGKHQASVQINDETPSEEPLLTYALDEETALIEHQDVVLDETIIESVVSAKITEEKALKSPQPKLKKEPILEPNTPRTSIAEAMIKHPVAVKTTKPRPIPASSIKVPSGLELNVDLMTYAELKKNGYYFFEVDTLKSGAGEELFDMDWDEADLKRHPDKDRYRMILKKNNERREIIVRLVKNPLQMKSNKKWRLFAKR